MPLSLLHLDGNRGWGGGQAQSLGLARALLARGCRVHLFVQSGSALAQRAGDVPVEELPLRGLAGAARLPWLMQQFRRLRPDLVHAHDSASQSLAVAAARAVGLPVVATRRTQFPLRGGRLARLKYDWCDRIICVSEAVRRECFRAGLTASRLVVIPDFVDCEHFRPAAEPAREAEVVAVGRLSAEKGHLVLVRAMAQVVEAMPQAHLTIYGEGPERAALEIAAAALGDRVSLPGFVADPREALASAAVVAMPSLSEGLGVAALEAMAMAKSVVATDAGGLPESVQDGVAGLVVPKGDTDALARALLALLRDPKRARRYGEAARARMREQFDRPRIVERVLALYQEVLT